MKTINRRPLLNVSTIDALLSHGTFVEELAERLMLSELLCEEADPSDFLRFNVRQAFCASVESEREAREARSSKALKIWAEK